MTENLNNDNHIASVENDLRREKGVIVHETHINVVSVETISLDVDAITIFPDGRIHIKMNETFPKWAPIAGAGFALLTIVFLMFFLLGPTVDPQKKTVFDVLMAFCASASAAFFGGNAVAHGRIPVFKDSPVEFSAVGGIGVFIVVFLLLHFA